MTRASYPYLTKTQGIVFKAYLGAVDEDVDEAIVRCAGGEGNCSSGTGTLETLVRKSDPIPDQTGRVLCDLKQFDASDFGVAFVAEPALWISPTDAATRGVEDGMAIRIVNERGTMQARAKVTDRIPAGSVWMRDGWAGLNDLTSGAPAIPDAAVHAFTTLGFSGGQATFDARVDVERAWS